MARDPHEPRNVCTLSHLPVDLHNWLIAEASRRSKEVGRRIGWSSVAVEAIEEYKAKHEGDGRTAQKEVAGVAH